jgi:hypothetical protein
MDMGLPSMAMIDTISAGIKTIEPRGKGGAAPGFSLTRAASMKGRPAKSRFLSLISGRREGIDLLNVPPQREY